LKDGGLIIATLEHGQNLLDEPGVKKAHRQHACVLVSIDILSGVSSCFPFLVRQ
jgi:hypothetical protein